jgi:pilus assembly protein TadC
MSAQLALLAVAVALWPEPHETVGARLRFLGWARGSTRRRQHVWRLPDGPLRRWVLAAAAAVPVGVLVGGLRGAGAAVVVLLVGERVLRRLGTAARTPAQDLRLDLPVACDLLAVCLAAGIPPPAALAAVGAAVPGALGAELVRVAGLSRLGADAHLAWQAAPPVLEPLARSLRRSEASGARAAPALHALAAEVRGAARAETDAAVQRAGIRILAPLGLCFLPAFVCLGVVPLVIGIAGEVLP